MKAARQQGIVLFMSLILLVIISLIAVVAIRGAISGEQVSKAMRTHTAAFQAAETALRYCEDQILKSGKISGSAATLSPAEPPADGSPPMQWRDRANWSAAGKAITLSADVVDSLDPAARKSSTLPQCMAESLWLPGEDGPRRAFLITAIGFSPDFRIATFKTPISGGEVWLQSTVTPKP